MRGERRKFFAAVERAVTGHTREQIDAANFFPALLLKTVAPRRMLVFSTESWKRFKRLENMTWQHVRDIEHDGHVQDTGVLASAGSSTRIYCMNVGHPAGWRWGDAGRWHHLVADFLSDPI